MSGYVILHYDQKGNCYKIKRELCKFIRHTSLPLRKFPMASSDPNTLLSVLLLSMSAIAFFTSIRASANSYISAYNASKDLWRTGGYIHIVVIGFGALRIAMVFTKIMQSSAAS